MLKSCVNQRAILVANERNEDISLQHVSCLSTKQQNNMIPHTEPKKKVAVIFLSPPWSRTFLYICVKWNILVRVKQLKVSCPCHYIHHFEAISDCTKQIWNYCKQRTLLFIRLTLNLHMLPMYQARTEKEWHGLTESRSLRPAPRVNFLAKRKQGAGFPLLVHHSLLFSVS